MDQSCCSISITPTESGVKIDFGRAAGHHACCCCAPGAPEKASDSSCCGESEKRQ